MNLGVTLRTAEKIFGPALPGQGAPDATLSAVRFAQGRGTKFAGIPGIQENAVFYIHFPTSIDWSLLTSKKGTPDFINDLRQSGPQGEQGREQLVAEFMAKNAGLREKLRTKKEDAEKKAFAKQERAEKKARAKQEATEKKARAAQLKEEATLLRQRFADLVGEQMATITIGSETVTMSLKITKDKSGKLKITGTI